MAATSTIKLIMASEVGEAISALADLGGRGAVLAGGTWIMRAPIRGELQHSHYVGIGRVPDLNMIDIGDDEITVGACVNHAQLVAFLRELRQCHGLVSAAGNAANPAIRQMATIGGNLSAWNFPASDILPALLCLDAILELHGTDGSRRVSVEKFIQERNHLQPATLLTKVLVPRRTWLTGHARLPLRKAGDYPVAIVSMAAQLAEDGTVEDVRVAVGSVEPSARRWAGLEEQLVGKALDPGTACELAKARLDDFEGRDSVEAPSWYRIQVLPTLVRRAAEAVVAGRRDI